MIKKIWLPLRIMALTAILSSVQAEDSELRGKSPLFDADGAGRLIVVAFPDQSMRRTEIMTGSPAYRRRGDYQGSTWSRRIIGQIAADYDLEMLSQWPMTAISLHCAVYRIPAGESAARTLEQLTKDRRISIAQPMHLYHTRAETVLQGDPYEALQLNLRQMRIDQAHAVSTGKDVAIAMIDTGVDLTHPDLIGQISKNENFADADSADSPGDRHGTAVAGVMIARKNNGIGIAGIAPDARLAVFRACWPIRKGSIESVCNSFTLALALNGIIKSDAKILNMSLTGPYDQLLELLLKKAAEQGVIIVAADSGQTRGDGDFPASLPDVIAVQSLPERASGKAYDSAIRAPGVKILTTLPHGAYDFVSGSSLAAAEASAIVALLTQISPDLTSGEARSILKRSQLPAVDESFGGINAGSAILALCEDRDCPEKAVNLARKTR